MPDRQAAPPFVQAKNFTLPDFHTVSVKNGIRLFTISGVQQDIIKIEMLFHAGRWVEQQPGISHFTSHLIEKGTRSKSSLQLAEAFDKLGAHIEISPGYDNVSISLYALRKNWKEAFSLMGEMILEPSFEEDELALMKSIFIQNLKVNLEKNSYVAGQMIRRNIFGALHPYGSTIEENDVLRIESKQLVDFYRQRFLPFAAFVTTHSSVSEDEIVKALASFSSFTGNASETYQVAPGPKDQNQDKQDSVQKSLRMGKRAITRSNPRYADLALFNHILGGYFGSRLMKNIREEKGLTYGIYSSLNPLRLDSFLVIGADVNKDNLGLALAEIRKEIDRLRKEEIGREELEVAKNHFLGSLQLEIANPFSVMEKVKNMHINNLPADYYQRLFARISKITPEELMEAGEKYFCDDDMHLVTVG